MNNKRVAAELVKIAKVLVGAAKVTKLQKTGKETLYKVEDKGVWVGFLTKYPNTRTETHPWKAFGVKHIPASPPQVGEYYGAFYEKDGGQKAAIKKIVKEAR